MKDRALIIAVVAVGTALGGLTATLAGFVINRQTALAQDVEGLHDRISRLEGMFEEYEKND